jgi:hypothetical protein
VEDRQQHVGVRVRRFDPSKAASSAALLPQARHQLSR